MDPTILFIIIFLVAPLLERLLKSRQQPPPPPQQRPRRERPQQMPRPRAEETRRAPLPRPEPRDEGERAADMLPDDLWEILTGQKRERPAPPPPSETPAPVATERAPVPQPRRPRPGIVRKPPRPPVEQERIGRMQSAPDRRPAPARVEAEVDEESQLGVEATREQFQVEGYVREIPVHKAPEIVSLEELVIDDEKRHARFHERVATLKASKVQRPGPHKIATLLRQSNEVRQAVLLREVLSRPRGLD